MTRILAGMALALLGVAALGQGPRPAPPADAVGADVQDVVFLADARPYRIRLHLVTHGRPFRSAPARLRKQDLDDDECVTVAEVLGLGPRGLAGGQFLELEFGQMRTEDSGPLVPVEPGAADLALDRRLLAQYGKDGAQRVKRAE